MHVRQAHADEATTRMPQRWMALCARISPVAPPETAAALFTALGALYQTPPRGYHNLHHVAACLAQFDAARSLAVNPDAVEWAIWLHDAIYVPGRPDNELRSADLAVALAAAIGTGADFQQTVRGLVLATTHREKPGSGDQELIVDIDLAGLAAPPDEYDRDAANIREEYAFVEDTAFGVGRRAFLEGLLARPRLYHTQLFRDRFEIRARENMTRAVAALRG